MDHQFFQLKEKLKSSKTGRESDDDKDESSAKSSKEEAEPISTSSTTSIEKAALTDKDARLVGQYDLRLDSHGAEPHAAF